MLWRLQMQIQMQTPKAEDSMTATCRRCHPELLAGRQLLAEEAFTSIVDEFQTSTTSLNMAGEDTPVVMVNGMPGPMATAAAEACLRKGLNLSPT